MSEFLGNKHGVYVTTNPQLCATCEKWLRVDTSRFSTEDLSLPMRLYLLYICMYVCMYVHSKSYDDALSRVMSNKCNNRNIEIRIKIHVSYIHPNRHKYYNTLSYAHPLNYNDD
jgi:hypothetical protein